jgi:hypothetical protein
MAMEHAYETLALGQITVDGGTQMRAGLDQDIIDEYAEAMEDCAVFPPVVVFFNGDAYWMGDGFHRYHAAGQAGHTTIKAEVRPGGRRDAQLFACGANVRHGHRRTNDDKRKAVSTLLADNEWGEWRNREIARHCGVSEHLVRSLRPSRSEDEDRRYITRHGTEATMDTSNIGKTSNNGDAPEPEPEDNTRTTPQILPTLEVRWRTEDPEFVHPVISVAEFQVIAEALDAMPPEQYLACRERRRNQNALAELLGEPPIPESDPVPGEGNQATQGWEKSFLDLSVLVGSVQDEWSALMATWSGSRKQLALMQLRQWHARLGEWIQAIEENLSHDTQVDDIAVGIHLREEAQTQSGQGPASTRAVEVEPPIQQSSRALKRLPAAPRTPPPARPPKTRAEPRRSTGQRWHALLVEIRQHLMRLQRAGLLEHLARSWSPDVQGGYRQELDLLIAELQSTAGRIAAVMTPDAPVATVLTMSSERARR